MDIILNTWVFEDRVKSGVSQAELVEKAAQLHADGLEIRREYFKDFATEMPLIAQKVREQSLILNYSVPDEVFLQDGSFNPKLKQYFDEAHAMGVTKIKFNTGNFADFHGDLAAELKQLPLDEIQMNVENDQTAISGTVTAIETFLTAAREVGINEIGYVYDLGNWAFTGGDAVEAAKKLGKYTHYIHLKNTIKNEIGLVTSDDLDDGLYDWRKLMTILPQDQMVAIEFPMTTDEQISHQIELLRNWKGR